MRKLPAGLAGTIQAQIVDEEKAKPQQIEESYRFSAEITWRVNLSPPQPNKGSALAYPSEGHTGSQYKLETLSCPQNGIYINPGLSILN
jgi:hypothetical protein